MKYGEWQEPKIRRLEEDLGNDTKWNAGSVDPDFCMNYDLDVHREGVPFTSKKLPGAMVAFYIAGLFCSLTFAILLALSAVGIKVIHPFLSLIGLVGGLGWLTTAWTDLFLWKRERSLGNRTPQSEETNTIAA